jgi:hypothetical protein
MQNENEKDSVQSPPPTRRWLSDPCNLGKKGCWVRWGAWLLVAALTLWVANIVAAPDLQIREAELAFKMRKKVERLWMAETGEVDSLNQMAKAYIAKHGLKPGDPLPPSTFAQKGNPLLEALDKKDPVQIVSQYKVEADGASREILVAFGTRATVPPKGEPYAVTSLGADPKVTGTPLWVHPRQKGTMALVIFTEQEIERKMRLLREKEAKTGTPKE